MRRSLNMASLDEKVMENERECQKVRHIKSTTNQFLIRRALRSLQMFYKLLINSIILQWLIGGVDVKLRK